MTGKGGPLTVLTPEQVQEVHMASLRVLERTGVLVQEETVLRLLAEVGAWVDGDKQLVRFPPWLVEEMVRRAPSRYTWHARDLKKSILMEGTRVHFGPTSNATRVLDLQGRYRPSTLEDADNFSRLAHATNNLHEVTCGVHPTDVPDGAVQAYWMLYMFRNSDKCVRGQGYGRVQAQDCLRMAEIVVGGSEKLRRTPFLSTHINPVSPLTHCREGLEAMLEYGRMGQPLVIASEVQSAATGPVTLAGTMVQHNAEVLSGIVIAQAINPGNPVAYGCVSSIVDARTAMFAYGAVEAGLLQVASAQMARFYHLPCRGTGGVTDAKGMDMQAGYETAMTLLMAAMGGVNYIHCAAGALDSVLVASFEKLMVDNEVLGMVLRALRGIEVREETLAVDLIDRIGPRGHYLAEEHTRGYLRMEHFIPELAAKSAYEVWRRAGEKPIHHLAREKAQQILSGPRPVLLDQATERELERYVQYARKRALGEGKG